MAEIEISSRKNKGHKVQHRSTRVDLTPMVDLGFLLLTFFVFTTALTEAKVMELKYPNDTTQVTDQVCETCALTLIAGGNDALYYYEGNMDTAQYIKINYTAAELRKLILEKKRKVLNTRGVNEMVLILKPGNEANFKNLIDLIDEASITGLSKYYIDEANAKEEAFLKAEEVKKENGE